MDCCHRYEVIYVFSSLGARGRGQGNGTIGGVYLDLKVGGG